MHVAQLSTNTQHRLHAWLQVCRQQRLHGLGNVNRSRIQTGGFLSGGQLHAFAVAIRPQQNIAASQPSPIRLFPSVRPTHPAGNVVHLWRGNV